MQIAINILHKSQYGITGGEGAQRTRLLASLRGFHAAPACVWQTRPHHSTSERETALKNREIENRVA